MKLITPKEAHASVIRSLAKASFGARLQYAPVPPTWEALTRKEKLHFWKMALDLNWVHFLARWDK